MPSRLQRLRDLPFRDVIGLNVGTSRDGVDAAWVRFTGPTFGDPFEVLDYHQSDLSPRLAKRLANCESWTMAEATEAHVELGEEFATAVETLTKKVGQGPCQLIGSHGATIHHRPPRGPRERGASLQLGDLSVLAERSGAVVIGDFRAADLAAGGQGAPLTPFLDYLLFREAPGTLALNLGGIANLSWIGESLDEILAFDTGPANLPLDLVTRELTKGEHRYDPEGRFAASGHVDVAFLDRLLAHPFLAQVPPKSTGREEFGPDYVAGILRDHSHRRLVDILATLTAFSSRAVRHAAAEWLDGRILRELVVSGGGVENLVLMDHLRRDFFPIPVRVFSECGTDAHGKEALLFAVLAHERLFERPGNLPSATGAGWPVGLGQVYY